MIASKRETTVKEEIAKSMTELWEALDSEKRNLLMDNMTISKYQKNETIYRTGDVPTHVAYLVQGKVKVYKDGVGNRPQIVRMIRPQEFFGYRAGFSNEEYKTSAAAWDDAVVCLIPVNVIKQLIIESSRVGIFFIKKLSEHLAVSETQVVNLTQKHLRARLAEALLRLQEIYGTDPEGTLRIRLSREELAHLSNMTTSNAIRTLTLFANEGMVEIAGKDIRLLNQELLQEISLQG